MFISQWTNTKSLDVRTKDRQTDKTRQRQNRQRPRGSKRQDTGSLKSRKKTKQRRLGEKEKKTDTGQTDTRQTRPTNRQDRQTRQETKRRGTDPSLGQLIVQGTFLQRTSLLQCLQNCNQAISVDHIAGQIKTFQCRIDLS